MILSEAQLTTYAQKAGFSGPALVTIVAIAMAESGGNTDAVNHSDPFGGSYGILQINGAHIQGVSGNSVSMSCVLDPQCSFNYAYQLSSGGTNFNPWGAYTNGSYQQYLNGNTGGSITVSPVSTSTLNPIASSGLWQFISDPTRLLKITFGLLLIGIALLLLIKPEVT